MDFKGKFPKVKGQGKVTSFTKLAKRKTRKPKFLKGTAVKLPRF